jgi:hypothetical protein
MRYGGNRVTLSHHKMHFLGRVILALPFVLRKDNREKIGRRIECSLLWEAKETIENKSDPVFT